MGIVYKIGAKVERKLQNLTEFLWEREEKTFRMLKNQFTIIGKTVSRIKGYIFRRIMLTTVTKNTRYGVKTPKIKAEYGKRFT